MHDIFYHHKVLSEEYLSDNLGVNIFYKGSSMSPVILSKPLGVLDRQRLEGLLRIHGSSRNLARAYNMSEGTISAYKRKLGVKKATS